MTVRRITIDFMGNKKYLFAFSSALVVISIAALLVNGLVFGIEFQGGSVMTFTGTADISVERMREALDEAGVEGAGAAVIQQTDEGDFIVRTSEQDADAASLQAEAVLGVLALPDQDASVTTIGPGWGQNVTNAALIALAVSIIAILGYISIRFEYKMSVTAVVALAHDVLIVLGFYALVGHEVTPNTVAALLTILGYSLYDTVVVFHRIRENSQNLVRRSFQQMANDSNNQVLARSINTTLTSLIPVVCLLVFGGSTLKDFAFALVVGLTLGAYSSVGVAAPLYALWKEREPRFQALKRKVEAHAAK
ncbi:MAG: protein translocase subunit SecF [Coriobacteriia bacterium]|nr:protein translocase subunit SecF [Coriobacteriia bacterium]